MVNNKKTNLVKNLGKDIVEWNNRLKKCQCYKPLNTKWGSVYEIDQIYKYTILTYEEMIERNDLPNKPVVINHKKGTDRFNIPDFNEHFIDFQTLRDNKISIILNSTHEKDTL
jgi:hypothetical protein